MPATPRVASNIYPGLCYDDAAAAIEWLCQAFGFQKRMAVSGPDGKIMHSELTYGDGVLMLGSPHPDEGRVSPKQLGGQTTQALSVRVDNPDEHYARAKAAGAEIVREVQEEEYGSRGYMAKDPEGHLWYFGTYSPGEYWEEERSDPATPDG